MDRQSWFKEEDDQMGKQDTKERTFISQKSQIESQHNNGSVRQTISFSRLQKSDSFWEREGVHQRRCSALPIVCIMSSRTFVIQRMTGSTLSVYSPWGIRITWKSDLFVELKQFSLNLRSSWWPQCNFWMKEFHEVFMKRQAAHDGMQLTRDWNSTGGQVIDFLPQHCQAPRDEHVTRTCYSPGQHSLFSVTHSPLSSSWSRN